MVKVRSSIILCLEDKILRQVAEEKIATSIWAKLESLYRTKSLAHILFLKQQLYSFRMVENKSIVEQLIEFHKIIDNIENIDDKDKIQLLLNSLRKYFVNFNDASFRVNNVLLFWINYTRF